MINYIIIAAVGAGVVFAILHIRRQRKKGGKCCGCPYSGSCSGSCSNVKDAK